MEIKLLRGNVQTRIEKLRRGEYDGILLAAAGLARLGLDREEGLHLEYLDKHSFVPAAGQGILAAEVRREDMEEGGRLEEKHSFRNCSCRAFCRTGVSPDSGGRLQCALRRLVPDSGENDDDDGYVCKRRDSSGDF